MDTILGKLLNYLGAKRDTWHWFALRCASVLTLVASGAVDLPGLGNWLGVHISMTASHWAIAVSILVLWVAGKMDTSPLPAKGADSTVNLSKLTPLFLIAAIGLGAIGLSSCAGNKPIPSMPTIAATTDKDFRAVEMKTYGLLQAGGVMLNQGSMIEDSLAKSGVITAAQDKTLRKAFTDTATQAKAVIDDIDKGKLTTPDELKQRVDPILANFNTIQTLAAPVGHPKLMGAIEGIAAIGIAILSAASGGGGLGAFQ